MPTINCRRRTKGHGFVLGHPEHILRAQTQPSTNLRDSEKIGTRLNIIVSWVVASRGFVAGIIPDSVIMIHWPRSHRHSGLVLSLATSCQRSLFQVKVFEKERPRHVTFCRISYSFIPKVT